MLTSEAISPKLFPRISAPDQGFPRQVKNAVDNMLEKLAKIKVLNLNFST
jgi:hypothetical protein